MLALRWIDNAVSSDDIIDKIISLWIAIETLIMNNTKIYPIQNALKYIYPQYRDMKDYFKVGILYKIRCDIVHSGKKIDLHPALIEYGFSLFYDLLNYVLGIESKNNLNWLIKETKFDIGNYYKEISR